MVDKAKPPRPGARATDRDDRLRAALKANMARRKAQKRARAGPAEPPNRDCEKDDRNG